MFKKYKEMYQKLLEKSKKDEHKINYLYSQNQQLQELLDKTEKFKLNELMESGDIYFMQGDTIYKGNIREINFNQELNYIQFRADGVCYKV